MSERSFVYNIVVVMWFRELHQQRGPAVYTKKSNKRMLLYHYQLNKVLFRHIVLSFWASRDTKWARTRLYCV
jgi:hypothetical protein